MTLDLEAEARSFGNELQSLLDGVLPYQDGVEEELRQVAVTGAGLAFLVDVGTAHAGSGQLIPLLSNGEHTASLAVRYRLVADSADQFPAVAKSAFELSIGRHPLLRLDFGRGFHTVPGCHWNVHAERGAVSRLLVRNDREHSGELAKVHLPVGGPRMRPCLEDFLQMLIVDFQFDAVDGWRQVLDEGRVLWRRRQLAAMVRDDPQHAADILQSRLGYDVVPPTDGHPPTKQDKLTAW